jgi:hypothetical protein
MVADPGKVASESTGLRQQKRGQSRTGGESAGTGAAGGGCIHIGISGHAIGKADFAGAMRIAWNSLLLCAPYIRAPAKSVVASRFDPVVDELKVVFGFFEGTVALIHSQRISKIETSVAVDVKRRHAAGFRSAEIQTGESGVGRRSGPADQRAKYGFRRKLPLC